MNRKDRRAADKVGRTANGPNRQDIFAEGLRCHRAGSLERAERLYRQVLSQNPRRADCLQLLGVLAQQTGRQSLAADLITQAIEIDPSSPSGHCTLGNLLRDQGRLEEAVASYRQAIDLKPDFGDAYNNLGVVLQELERFDEAAAIYRAAYKLEPGDIGILHNLGSVLLALEQYDEAIACSRQARALHPEIPGTHANLGLALLLTGKFEEATTCCQKALELAPQYANAHDLLGRVLYEQGKFEQAITAHNKAIDLQPELAEAHNNLGSSLVALGDLAQAIDSYRRAIAIRPTYAYAHSNLANALRRLGHFSEACGECHKAIEISPGLADAHNNLAIATLTLGDMRTGWQEYEWRRKASGSAKSSRVFVQPQWRGESNLGQTLLIHAEQGLGDSLQFCRYAPLAADRGLRVIMEVPSYLIRILRSLGAVELIAAGSALPDFDFHCPMLSLPLAFATDLGNIPARSPYLRADPDRTAAWKTRLGPGGFRVGIAWQGNPNHIDDRGRSAPLRCFEPLATLPNVRLISLQKHHGLEQLLHLPRGMAIETLGDDFDSGPDAFLDTAAVMENLDLIVSTDTSIVHLAGALGRPVWVALSAVPDWRWMLDRTDCPWYPTMQLFRQNVRGDWNSVFDTMTARLREMVCG